MERAEKAELVTALTASFRDAGSIIVARNTGLTVADLENLRRQMKEAGGTVKLAYSEDPITAPKVAAAFAEKNQKFEIVGGAMGATGLDADRVKTLAKLPSLDELRATLAGMLKQPATRIASVLQAPGGQVARVIAAYAEKSNAA